MRNCFVPGCDQLCKLNGTTKRKMFVVPKDNLTFDTWKEILPKQRVLKSHDKVCERHFSEQDICTTYDTVVNGKLYKMERGRPKLRVNAFPTKNISVPHVRPTKKPQMRISLEIVEREQLLDTDEDAPEIVESTPKRTPSQPETTVTYEVSSTDSTIEVSEAQIRELYDSLYDDIYEVVLPNTLWGVHRCLERTSVFFSYVDPSVLRTTKMIAISCHGEIKVLLGNRLVNEQNLIVDITSLESLSEMIAETDALKLCFRMFDNDFCDVTLKEDSSDVCETCAQTETL